ncbi:MAG: ABC transporter permease [Flavobacteriales bacterium]
MRDSDNRIQRIWILAKHDFLQRYYGSSLGVIWAFLNPIFRLAIYYFVFAFLIFKNRDPDFVLYLYLGVMPWTFFAESTKRGMKVFNNKRYLIENIQIAKYDLFIAHIVSVAFALAFNMAIYFIFRLFFDVELTLHVLWLPWLLLNLICVGFLASITLSTIFLFIRDLDHVWDILLMAMFWTVPIIWDQRVIFDHYSFMLYINPLTGIVINIREVLLYGRHPVYDLLLYDLAFTLILAAGSLLIFKRYAKYAAELR